MNANLTQLLLDAAQNPDPAKRRQAEAQLQEAESNTPGEYFTALGDELANSEKGVVSRQLGGLLLKNALSAKDSRTDGERRERWLRLPGDSVRAPIKAKVLAQLNGEHHPVRIAACQVVAKIGCIELPQREWHELMPTLVQAVSSGTPPQKHAALTALGYLCEELSLLLLSETTVRVDIPSEVPNQSLTAITVGMQDADESCKEAATKALFHALGIAHSNFKKDEERNYIIQAICNACKSTNPKVQVAAFECVVQIATEYYDFLHVYISVLAQLTLEAVGSPNESIGIAALEFWSTLCDEEIYLEECRKDAECDGTTPERQSFHFVKQSLEYLLPTVLGTLSRQHSEEDEDSWTIAMAAGTCLQLVSQAVGNAVLPPVLAYVNEHFAASDWRKREAAIFAYGSVMEGPTSEALADPVTASLPSLLKLLGSDSSVAVRDTAAWAASRIAQFHPTIAQQHLQGPANGSHNLELLPVLVDRAKNDAPRVASKVCQTVHLLAQHISDGPRGASEPATPPLESSTPQISLSNPLSPAFQLLVNTLLDASARLDADEAGLREDAYNALSVLITNAGEDCKASMPPILQHLLTQLQRSLQEVASGAASPEALRQALDVQELQCGCLQVLTTRLRQDVAQISEPMAEAYTGVIRVHRQVYQTSEGLSLPALHALNSLFFALGEQIGGSVLGKFLAFIGDGLKNSDDIEVCKACIDMFGDLCRQLPAETMKVSAQQLIVLLVGLLKNANVDRSLKPIILTVIGDMAPLLFLDGDNTLPHVMHVLHEAAQTRMAPDTLTPQPTANGSITPTPLPPSEDWVEYVNTLRDAVFQAYTGIIHAVVEHGKIQGFVAYASGIVELVEKVVNDPSTPSVLSSAVSVLGDLVCAYKHDVAPKLAESPVVRTLMDLAAKSDNYSCVKNAAWLRELLQKYSAIRQ